MSNPVDCSTGQAVGCVQRCTQCIGAGFGARAADGQDCSTCDVCVPYIKCIPAVVGKTGGERGGGVPPLSAVASSPPVVVTPLCRCTCGNIDIVALSTPSPFNSILGIKKDQPAPLIDCDTVCQSPCNGQEHVKTSDGGDDPRSIYRDSSINRDRSWTQAFGSSGPLSWTGDSGEDKEDECFGQTDCQLWREQREKEFQQQQQDAVERFRRESLWRSHSFTKQQQQESRTGREKTPFFLKGQRSQQQQEKERGQQEAAFESQPLFGGRGRRSWMDEPEENLFGHATTDNLHTHVTAQDIENEELQHKYLTRLQREALLFGNGGGENVDSLARVSSNHVWETGIGGRAGEVRD
eukprot:CAMPEP_0175143504 /NCGR_PEP_ID=MMETSP0087-20121206/13477_1 /TAXON_ID=136419 /ORGANISM="Unknown Unknown, Strain D1" /LENGTH=351 /DNA_ID=CAMNT_0016427597 /DNA_START=387 /DNA_END=1442 /DNA_ORIENTATION=-